MKKELWKSWITTTVEMNVKKVVWVREVEREYETAGSGEILAGQK